MSDSGIKGTCGVSLGPDDGEEAKDRPGLKGLERVAALFYEVMHMQDGVS